MLDITCPKYSQIVDRLRMAHVNGLLAGLRDAARADVISRLREVSA